MRLDYADTKKKGGGGRCMHAGHHLLWPLLSAYASSTGKSFGGRGIFPWICMKMNYILVLSDTAVDVKIWHKNIFQGGDFGEIDILVYKFGRPYRNLGVND